MTQRGGDCVTTAAADDFHSNSLVVLVVRASSSSEHSYDMVEPNQCARVLIESIGSHDDGCDLTLHAPSQPPASPSPQWSPGFHLVTEGQDCEAQGLASLTTWADCKAGNVDLGLTDPFQLDTCIGCGHDPPYCYFDVAGGRLHFNDPSRGHAACTTSKPVSYTHLTLPTICSV